MRAEGVACCASRRRLASVGLAYAPAALLAMFLPKCPLCLGALLAVLGVSGTLPSYSYGVAVAVSAVLGTLVLVRRARTLRRPTWLSGDVTLSAHAQ